MDWKERAFIIIVAIVTVGAGSFVWLTRSQTSSGNAAATAPTPVVQKAPLVTYLDPAIGGAKATKTIVMYANYACPFCKAAESDVRTLVINHPEVRLVWKDLPDGAPQTELAAEAAQCAKAQGKFWEYHDALFASGGDWSDAALALIANQVGIDPDTFHACLSNHEMQQFIEHTVSEGKALGINATPTYFIGSKPPYVGQLSYDQLEAAIR